MFSSKDVRDELKVICDAVSDVNNSFEVTGIYTNLDKVENSLQRIGEVAEFSGDSLQRRATALQKSAPRQNVIQLNAKEIQTARFATSAG